MLPDGHADVVAVAEVLVDGEPHRDTIPSALRDRGPLVAPPVRKGPADPQLLVADPCLLASPPGPAGPAEPRAYLADVQAAGIHLVAQASQAGAGTRGGVRLRHGKHPGPGKQRNERQAGP